MKKYIRAYDDDEWDIEDEYPYTMTLAGDDMSKWDEDCWAYYIAKKENYDEDEYNDLLHDINNLRANEYIENEWFDNLSKKDIEAFKKFIKYNDDEEDEE